MKIKPKRIVLGSGSFYRMDFSGELPKLDAICVEANRFSHIKNGATIEYTKETITEKDDKGLVQKTVIQSEDVLLKCGLMTFTAQTLKYLAETARVTETEDGKILTKIGGIDNADNTSYVWCFHHEDKKDGDIWVLIVGKNNAGVTLEYKPDGATVIDAEIKAEPCDNEGTLIYYYEENLEASAAKTSITSTDDKTKVAVSATK